MSRYPLLIGVGVLGLALWLASSWTDETEAPPTSPNAATAGGESGPAAVGRSDSVDPMIPRSPFSKAPVGEELSGASMPATVPILSPPPGIDGNSPATTQRSAPSASVSVAPTPENAEPSTGERIRSWHLAGPKVAAYELFADSTVSSQGKLSATLRALNATPASGDYAMVLQHVKARPFRGRRVRFSADVRTERAGGATIALAAVDVNGTQITPKFMLVDSSRRLPLSGSTGWTRLGAVVDIPAAAEILTYGGVLVGSGAAWFDAAAVEIVEDAVLTTQPPLMSQPFAETNAAMTTALDAPSNLDFEDLDRTPEHGVR